VKGEGNVSMKVRGTAENDQKASKQIIEEVKIRRKMFPFHRGMAPGRHRKLCVREKKLEKGRPFNRIREKLGGERGNSTIHQEKSPLKDEL